MSARSFLFIGLLALVLTGLGLLLAGTGQWHFFWFLVAMGALLGGFELHFYLTKKETISSLFLKIARAYPRVGAALILLLATVFSLVAYHLLGGF